ncbi:hypothetical protein BH10ACI3_BH10ACI3_16560 [soil metagenome]
MKNLILLIIASTILASCGGGAGNSTTAGNSGAATKPASGGSAIDVKIKDKTDKLEPKSAFVFSDDWTINMPDGRAVPTSTRQFVIANYDLDTTYGKSSAMNKVTTPGQIRLVIQLQDRADVKKDMPVTVGDYVGKTEEFFKISNVMVYTFADGSETKTLISGSNSDNKGSVKITNVSGDTVTGEIDFSNTDNSFKGSFTAKAWKPAQK